MLHQQSKYMVVTAELSQLHAKTCSITLTVKR